MRLPDTPDKNTLIVYEVTRTYVSGDPGYIHSRYTTKEEADNCRDRLGGSHYSVFTKLYNIGPKFPDEKLSTIEPSNNILQETTSFKEYRTFVPKLVDVHALLNSLGKDGFTLEHISTTHTSDSGTTIYMILIVSRPLQP